MTWEIAVGVFTMASAFIAVMNAAMKVNKTLTSLEEAVKQLRSAIDRQSEKNGYFYRKLGEHDRAILLSRGGQKANFNKEGVS